MNSTLLRPARAALFALLVGGVVSGTLCAGTFTVTTTNDVVDSNDGVLSLREAIAAVNLDSTTPRVVNFAIGTGMQTITLGSALPTIVKFMTIDGTSQPGYDAQNPKPMIVLDGNFGDFDGLTVNDFLSGASANVTLIKGLCIINCGTNGGTPRNGMALLDGDNVTVTGCYVGINQAGTTAARNTGAGIACVLPMITNIGGTTAADRNVISGNLGAGIDARLDDTNQGAPINVLGCYIGVGADGASAVPNGGDGIHAIFSFTSAALKIGNNTAASRNVISGNGRNGIYTERGTTINNAYIGVAANGATALGNTLNGIDIEKGTTHADGGNVISANGGDGVFVHTTAPFINRSTVNSDFVGTDATGMFALGNGGFGVNITQGSASMSSSVISGNTNFGVHVASGDGSVFTSKIGVNADASAKLPNGGGGIWIVGVPNLTLTLSTISGNAGPGILIQGATAIGNKIQGNGIGVSGLGGALDLGNDGDGVEIKDGAAGTIIGSLTLNSDVNDIRFNGGLGINADTCTRIFLNRVYNNSGSALGGGGFFAPGPGIALAPTSLSDEKDVTVTVNDPAHPSAAATVFIFLNDAKNSELQSPLGGISVTTDASGKGSGTARLVGDYTSFPFSTGVTVINPNDATGCTSVVATGGGGGGTPPPPTLTTNTDSNHVSSTTAVDPVNTFTGELFALEKVDLNLGGPMPLVFARYYGSMITSDGNITSALGRNRLHNFDAKLIVAAPNATVVLNDGRAVQFARSGTKWALVVRTDIAFQLVQSGTNFSFADPRSQQIWTFDANGKLMKIEDGRGNAHTLHYDANANPGRLTSVTDGLGRTLAFTYDANGHLMQVRDMAADAPNPAVREVNFTYNGNDLFTAADSLSHTTTYSYDGNGHLLSTQYPRTKAPYSQTYASERVTAQLEHPDLANPNTTQTTTLSYNTGTHTTTINDSIGTRIHTYTATGELASLQDEAGRMVAFSSDATGRRGSVTDPLGRAIAITYHALSGKPASVRNEDGATTSFTYKARALGGLTFYDLTKIAYPDGTSRSFVYDKSGNVTSAVDQLGKKSTFTYNTHGQLLTAANATGGTASFTYDPPTGNLTKSKDSDTGEESYLYDAFSRLTKVTHPDATHLDVVYDDASRITMITDERGHSFSLEYDENSNVTAVNDAAGKMTKLGYDALDRVVQATDRVGKVRKAAYDTRDLLASTSDELTQATTLTYDSRQRITKITTPDLAETTLAHDDAGRITSVTDPLQHTSSLSRNASGRVVAVTDPLHHTATVQRDSMQRITKMIEPLGRQTSLTYDKRGQVIAATRDAVGTGTYVRDPVGRLLKLTDPNHGAWSFAYSPGGLLHSVKDPLGRTTSYAYDMRGRAQTIQLPEGGTCAFQRNETGDITRLNYSGQPGGAGPDLQFTYDALRQVATARTGVTANDIAFTRDFEGRIITATQGGVDFAATYDDAGRLATATYPNNFVVTYAYDANDRVTMVSDNSTSAVSVSFIYDLAGRPKTITRKINNAAAPPDNVTMLTYDDADRLTRIQDGTLIDLQYTLNAEGDITAASFTAPLVPAVAAATTQYKYDDASQISATGYSYDGRGRLTAAPGQTFNWDGASRLTSINGTTTLAYDALGDVATRSAGGVTTRLFYHHAIEGHPLVAEQNGSNSAFIRYYVWTPAGVLLYSIDAGTAAPRFYHFDRVGTTLALTDGTGQLTDAYSHTPYGVPLGHSPGTSTQPFTFVGALGVRAESGLFQMGARYYEPLTGRFLTRDPSGPRLTDPRSLDPYLYALGNPTRYVDRDGANSDDVALGIFFYQTFLQTHGFAEIDPENAIGIKVKSGNYDEKDPQDEFVKTNVVPPVLPPTEVFTPTPGNSNRSTTYEDFLVANGLADKISTFDLNAVGRPPAETTTRAGDYAVQAITSTGGSAPNTPALVDSGPVVPVRLGGGEGFASDPFAGAAILFFQEALTELRRTDSYRIVEPVLAPVSTTFDGPAHQTVNVSNDATRAPKKKKKKFTRFPYSWLPPEVIQKLEKAAKGESVSDKLKKQYGIEPEKKK